MFLLNLVFLALLAASTAQTGIPRYIHGQWMISDDDPQYEDIDGLSLEDSMWPVSPPEVVEVVTEGHSLLTTAEPYVIKEQDSDEGEESTVWKIVLVAVILLVSIVGSLSISYYMCVWRGGRIHYKPQRDVYP